MKISYLAVFLPSVLVFACGSKIDRTEIPGIYIANYGFGADTIELKTDGKYLQRVRVKGVDSSFSTTGSWTYDSAIEYVSIENMILIEDANGKQTADCCVPSNGIALLPVVKPPFQKRISIGTEETTPYFKSE